MTLPVPVIHGSPRLVLLLSIMFALSACSSPETRHKVLEVFFTGVPEPGSEQQEKKRPLTAAERVAAARQARIRANFRPPEMFIHGPRASKECDGCHAVRTGPRMFSKGSEDGGDTKISPDLARPITELCTTCHSEKSGVHAESLGLKVHKPVADGRCVDCHHPHAAPRRFMLLGDDTLDLCMTCHEKNGKGGVPQDSVHARNPDKDCLECHNPHAGKTAHLLKADFDEWQLYERVQ